MVRLEVALVKDLISTRFGFWEERIEMKSKKSKGKGPLTNRFMRKRTIIVVEEKGSDYLLKCEISSHPYKAPHLRIR